MPPDSPHVIELGKLTDYLLSATHPTGKAKAYFFNAFGFHLSDAVALADALEEHARTRIVSKVIDGPFGVKREVRCNLTTPDGRNPCIVAIWLEPKDRRIQRFITAYPAPIEQT